MRNLPVILLLFVVILLSAGCERRIAYMPELLAADDIMDRNPDSALILLNDIDTSRITASADSALYNLLLTQTMVKTDIPTDELRVQKAVDYFRGTSEHRYAMLSLYYLGYLQTQSGRYDRAITTLFEAESLAESTENWFYLGLIDRSISTNYQVVYSMNMSLEYELKAVDAFKKSGNEEYWNYERCNLAVNLCYSGKPIEAENVLDSVINLAIATKDSVTEIQALAFLFSIKLYQNKWAEGIKLYDSVFKRDSSFLDFTEKQRLLAAYIMLRMRPQADSLYRVIQATNKDLHISLHKFYASEQNYKAAYESLLNEYDNIRPHILKIQQQYVSTAEHNYRSLQLEKTEFESQRQKFLTLVASIAGLLIAVLLTIYFYRRKKKLQQQITSLSKDYNLIQLELREISSRSNNDSANWSELFKKQFALIDNLYEEYYSSPSGKLTANITKKVRNLLNDIPADRTFIENIFADIDKYNSNLISDLKASANNRLSEQDYALLALLCAGFSNQAISIILDIELQPLYVRKSRLKSKIKNLNFPRTPEILALI